MLVGQPTAWEARVFQTNLIETADERNKTIPQKIPNTFQKLHKFRRRADSNCRGGKHSVVVSDRADAGVE
jgi:hypothetical protein